MNQPEENPPREEEVASPPTNPVPNAQQMLETMQLMLIGRQGGAQLGGPQARGASRPGRQGAPHLVAPLGAPLGALHRGSLS